jgi:type I restriction enzyme S subunit
MAMNQSCYALQPKDGENQYFYFLSMKNAIKYVKGISKSGVFDNIIVDTFKIIPLAVPQKPILDPI